MTAIVSTSRSAARDEDTAGHLAAREGAMRLHASQRSPFDGLPDDLRRDFLTSERLRRVRPEWTGGPTESALLPAPR